MSDSDDIVSRADAFMNRQRSALTPADELDDLPVLTDVVFPEQTESSTPASMAMQQHEQLTQALAEALKQRLAAEIPTLVEAAVQAALPSIAREIRLGLEVTTQSTIRDFIKSQTKSHP